jgi:L,D-peptidoglycan transpeptidase YkuD (ErfK/YbiS/YcfS/YnhG family)
MALPAAGRTSSVPTVAVRPLTLTTAWAPHVPGARRFDRTIPTRVRQVLVVRAPSWRSRTGTLVLYNRTRTGWHFIAAWPARLGYGGLVVGTLRRQDTGTTPAGSYSITQGFGRAANPGTRMPYTKVTDDHWWVEDRRSAYYNNMRLGRLGGFARTTRGYNSSERLARMGAQYDYAAVIDFNRPHPVIGRGAGIFLHAFGTGYTAGCVSIDRAHIRAVLHWLQPTMYPRIIIGTAGWLGP